MSPVSPSSRRTHVERVELAQQVAAAPAMARLRTVVEFVGSGRPATQAGNLKPADGVALARMLDPSSQATRDIRSMNDLPEVVHAFGWAGAAGFLARRPTKIVAGPFALDIETTLDRSAARLRAAFRSRSMTSPQRSQR